MESRPRLADEIRKLLQESDLSFRDFVELALYHPGRGYYTSARNPVGKEADYVTSGTLSPVFAFSLARLCSDFLRRTDDEVSTVVDIGCGDGSFLLNLWREMPLPERSRLRAYGVDRSLSRISSEARETSEIRFVRDLAEVPREGAHLIFSNELFDAFPFARLVQRDEHLHELWVTDRDGEIDWTEHEAPGPYEDYFAERGIELLEGQFADVSLEWGEYYADLCRFLTRGLIVTFDYGFPERQLFDPRIRRYGTAASYSQQRVTRDLLRNPGEQDLTAHINFSDLIRAGEREGLQTLAFERQARFLLSLGAAEHPLFQPVTELSMTSVTEGVDLLAQREEARRLILPDGIGEDIRVLVQTKGMDASGWGFQRRDHLR